MREYGQKPEDERLLRAARPEPQPLSDLAAEALLIRALRQTQTHRRSYGQAFLAGVGGIAALAGVTGLLWRMRVADFTHREPNNIARSEAVSRPGIPYNAAAVPANRRVSRQRAQAAASMPGRRPNHERKATTIAQAIASGYAAAGHRERRAHVRQAAVGFRSLHASSASIAVTSAAKRSVTQNVKATSIAKDAVKRDVVKRDAVEANARLTRAENNFDLPTGGRLVVVAFENENTSHETDTTNQVSRSLTMTTGNTATLEMAAAAAATLVNVVGTSTWTQCAVERNAVGVTTTRYVSTWATNPQKPGGLIVTTETTETTEENE